MAASGHHAQLLVENSPAAMHVLRRRFPDTKLEADVRDVASPAERHRPRGRGLPVPGPQQRRPQGRNRRRQKQSRRRGAAAARRRRRAVGGAGERAVPDVAGPGRRAAARHDGADRARLPVGVPRRRHQCVRPAAAAQPVVPGRRSRVGDPRDVLLADDCAKAAVRSGLSGRRLRLLLDRGHAVVRLGASTACRRSSAGRRSGWPLPRRSGCRRAPT